MATAKLDDLHLANLHERAAAAGVRDYRKLTRAELIAELSSDAEPGPSTDPGTPGRDAEETAGIDSRAEEVPGSDAQAEETEGIDSTAGVDSEADTDEIPIEATLLDPVADEPVELGMEGAEGGDERDDSLPTENARGVLELTRQRYGFVRLGGLTPSRADVYISAAQVRRCELRPGDEVYGPAREPRPGENHRALVHVDEVNGEEPLTELRPQFDDLAPVLPERRMTLETGARDLLARAVDLLAPLGFGQRVLIRAAPRSGRTTLLRSIAHAAATNENARVIIVLVDERPEEGTAWREAIPVAEFAIATADLAPVEQVRTADLAVERARRLAELGLDAVLVCDSLSRLAFAAGGVDEVKRLFGSGRNLAGAGSVTVLATVLDDARDEHQAERAVITTESSLIELDAELAAAGIVPALKPNEVRVSNEDQIREPAELEAARRLRLMLADLGPTEAAQLLRERLEGSASNAELLSAL